MGSIDINFSLPTIEVILSVKYLFEGDCNIICLYLCNQMIVNILSNKELAVRVYNFKIKTLKDITGMKLQTILLCFGPREVVGIFPIDFLPSDIAISNIPLFLAVWPYPYITMI